MTDHSKLKPSLCVRERRRGGELCPTPFLKWAGGKQWLAAAIAPQVRSTTGTYFEPFLGGGSLFFAALPRKAYLGDTNARLIETYKAIRNCPTDTIRYLRRWAHTRTIYYRLRSVAFTKRATRAAQFIYLNRTAWNGLYRVNRQGQFNVPFGKYTNPTICDTRLLLTASRALQTATLVVGDFEDTTALAKRGDVVYFDPPYSVAHSSNGFVRYNEHLFAWHDQIRLARVAHRLSGKGVIVLVSNARHSSIAALYTGFHKITLTRRSTLAADPARRGTAAEFLFSSEPIHLRLLHGRNGAAP